MATNLVSLSLHVPSGSHESAVITIPSIKQAGAPLNLNISMGAEQFPTGTTTITLFISTDGGLTFNSAQMTCVMPATFRGAAPHFWNMSYSLGPDDVPTHAKYSTVAPSAFITQTTVTAG